MSVDASSLDQQYVDHLGEMPSNLIFIMGCHRSGTTFLHNLLARTGAFDYVSTYEVIRYRELIYNRLHNLDVEARVKLQNELIADGPNRGIDQIAVDVEAPEEYGFILPGYDLFLPRITPPNLSNFQEICRKKRYLKGTDQPLLLKEPNEFYGNLAYVQEQFPDARYIINHRHPLTVLTSHIKSWSSVYDQENRYLFMLNQRYRQIMSSPIERMHYRLFMHTENAVEFVINQLVSAFNSYLDQLPRIRQSPCLIIKYEDLCDHPEQRMGDLMTFLDKPQRVELDGVVDRRISPAPEMIHRIYTRHLDRIKPYLDALGYPPYP